MLFRDSQLYHPDKNKAASAEEKFKNLGEAYHVLTDPERRALYNKYGRVKDLEPAEGFPDGSIYYKKGFGGTTMFKDFLGDMTFQEMIERQNDRGIGELQERQNKRVELLTKIMLERLASYDRSDGSEQARTELQQNFIAELEPLLPNGLDILNMIGAVYTSKAKMYLGFKRSRLPTFIQNMIEKKNILKDLWIMVQAAADAKSATERLYEAEMAQLSPETIEDFIAEAGDKGASSLWISTQFELKATIRAVCDAVLYDESADSATRRRRAEGLEMLGLLCERPDLDKFVVEMIAEKKESMM
ncbi:X-domain of DnaJ-containing-domain-containing protein [Dichotomocladium elegans]|nr:X-domain of DnaJ-containing-domain-containing protein [Dichotomocladium elegans]